MMKHPHYLFGAALAATLLFSACAPESPYDPSKNPAYQAQKNPLGDDFVAPDGFLWTMTESRNLNVTVNDEFDGMYNYLVEVFYDNPLDADLLPVAYGYAKKGTSYSTSIVLPQAADRLFVRQTDPKGRKEIYEVSVPKNGGTINAQLYYTAVTGRSMTRAGGSAVNVHVEGTPVEDTFKYTEQNYGTPTATMTLPTLSSEAKATLPAGSVAVIAAGTEYLNEITAASGAKSTLYVAGTWKPSNKYKSNSSANMDVIVLNGGKIIVGDCTLAADTRLIVQSGGSVEASYLRTVKNGNNEIRNFGTITASNEVIVEDAGVLYNKGSLKSTTKLIFRKSNTVINYGTLESGQIDLHLDGKMLNAENSSMKATYALDINISQLDNKGTVEVNGLLNTNQTLNCIVNNYPGGTLNATHLKGGGRISNNGLMTLTKWEKNSEQQIYNGCTMVITESFKFANLTMDKGSITAGKNATGQWMTVPVVSASGPATVLLKNGSIIKAGRMEFLSQPNTVTGEGTEKSMIKAETIAIEAYGPTTFSGNLVLERTNLTGKGKGDFRLGSGVATTGYDDSKYDVETCSAIINEGNEGGTPANPEAPQTVGDNTIYTFAFEDNWPVYGDFDMNDVVISIQKKEATVNSFGLVKEFKLQGRLEAIGASRKVGVGVRFMSLPANVQLSELKGKVHTGTPTLEAGHSHPVIIVTTDGHRYIGNAEGDRDFVNTKRDGVNKKDVPNFEISMKFATPSLQPSAFDIQNLDLFIITQDRAGDGKRQEVHVVGFPPTEVASLEAFGQGNDNTQPSAQKYYQSTENLAWGIVIPAQFAWLYEAQNIKSAYSGFAGWVTSGGQQDTDWYTKGDAEKLFSHP